MIGKTSEERSELLDSSTSPIHTRSLYFQMWPKSCSCLTELYNHANRLPARKVDRERASCCKFPRESVGCTNQSPNGWKERVFGRCCLRCQKPPHCGLHYLADLQSMGCHECLLMLFLIDILRTEGYLDIGLVVAAGS